MAGSNLTMPSNLVAMRAFFDRFVELPNEVWQAVLRIGHPARLSKKQILLEPGQVCDRMIFRHRGAIRAYRKPERLSQVAIPVI